jgi:phage shock protein C
MNCPACHRDIADYSNFCYFCGARLTPSAASRRLMRSVLDKKIAGVCGGCAEYFQVEPTILRIVWLFVTLATGIVPGALAYVVAWILMPQAPYITAPVSAPHAAAPGPGPTA